MSSISEPVEMTGVISATRSPMRITEPLPNCLSIWLRAADSARFLFSSMARVLKGWCRVGSRLDGRHRKGCDDRARIEYPLAAASPESVQSPGRRGKTARVRVRGSPVRPHQAAVQPLDGEVLIRQYLDRFEVRVARQQPDPVLADLQQLDRDLLVDPRDHDLAGTRVRGTVHADQVAVEDAFVAHRVALDLEQVVGRRREQ